MRAGADGVRYPTVHGEPGRVGVRARTQHTAPGFRCGMETVGGKAQLSREDWVALTQPGGRLRDSLGGGDVALALGPRVMAATWPGQRV